MRHRVSGKRLGRDRGHRTALQKSLSRSLILDGKIETTLAKAKFVKPYVEKLVTKAKKGPDFTTINRVYEKLGSKEATRVLFEDISPRFVGRNGGYTRIVKLGFRDGDKAAMVRLEWVVGKKGAKGKKDKTHDGKTEKDQKPVESTKPTADTQKKKKTLVKKSQKVKPSTADAKKTAEAGKDANETN